MIIVIKYVKKGKEIQLVKMRKKTRGIKSYNKLFQKTRNNKWVNHKHKHFFFGSSQFPLRKESC